MIFLFHTLFTLSRSTMAAARTPAAAAMADTHSELYWFGRMSAAARLMLAYTTIVVRFSADGAASIERLEINESENTAGDPQVNRAGPTAAKPSGNLPRTVSLPPGLRISAKQVDRAGRRGRRNVARDSARRLRLHAETPQDVRSAALAMSVALQAGSLVARSSPPPTCTAAPISTPLRVRQPQMLWHAWQQQQPCPQSWGWTRRRWRR